MIKDLDYIHRVLKPYDIKKENMQIWPDRIKIMFPSKKEDYPKNLIKLKDDVKSGKFRPDRLISWQDDTYLYNEPNLRLVFVTDYKISQENNILYHWTKAENIESIFTSGLKPSSVKEYTGDMGPKYVYKGIFLAESSVKLLKRSEFRFYKRPRYQLLAIRKSGLKLWKDNNIRTYPGEIDPGSYVVFDTIIDPKYMTIVPTGNILKT